jgi:hypothetical protein
MPAHATLHALPCSRTSCRPTYPSPHSAHAPHPSSRAPRPSPLLLLGAAQGTIQGIKELHEETGEQLKAQGIDPAPFVVKPSKRKQLAKKTQQSAVAAADGAGDKVAALLRLGINPHAINKVVGAATINTGPVMEATLQQMANELRTKNDSYNKEVTDFTELTSAVSSMIKDARTSPSDAIDKLPNANLKLLVKFVSLEKGLPGARPTNKKLMLDLIGSYDGDEWDEMLQSPTYLDRLIKPNTDAAAIIANVPDTRPSAAAAAAAAPAPAASTAAAAAPATPSAQPAPALDAPLDGPPDPVAAAGGKAGAARVARTAGGAASSRAAAAGEAAMTFMQDLEESGLLPSGYHPAPPPVVVALELGSFEKGGGGRNEAAQLLADVCPVILIKFDGGWKQGYVRTDLWVKSLHGKSKVAVDKLQPAKKAHPNFLIHFRRGMELEVRLQGLRFNVKTELLG